MSTKPRETIYGASIRASAERAKDARKEADCLRASKFAPGGWELRPLREGRAQIAGFPLQ